MSDDGAFEYKDHGLNDLLRALGVAEIPQAKVGVLGGKDARAGGNSNASIGMKHEFGEVVEFGGKTFKLPVRSFLRIPIIENMQKYLENAGLNDSVVKDAIKSKSMIDFVKKIGLVGEQIVSDAFSSSGFGRWKPSNMAFKKNHQTLVETQQLRNSITSEVK